MSFGEERDNPRIHAEKTKEKKISDDLKSREYKIFEEEEKLATIPRTIYEKLCNGAAKLIKVEPDEKTTKLFEEAIKFSHLRTTPTGVTSFTILFTLAILIPVLGLIIGNLFFGIEILSFGAGIMIMMLILPFVYYMYMYPLHLKKNYEIKAGSEIVNMVMYIAMYMRNTPNLEASVRFTSENVTGPLGLELRKLMWDVEVGNYITMEEALIDLTSRWKNNKEFNQAIELIIASLRQNEARRVDLLNESVNVILQGNSETAKHFAQELKTPVMIVNALGIILPVLGLIMFPLIAVFLNIGPMALFIGYDIILPLILYFIIVNILETRPSTFSKLNIEDAPGLPPEGKFFLNKKAVPAWPFGLLVGGIIFGLGYYLFTLWGTDDLISPIIMAAGIAFGFGTYYYLITKGRDEVREETREIESEFGEIIFQIGNQMFNGVPIEVSVEQSISRVKTLKIKDLFTRALNNMKKLGMTFRQAFFDKKYGAVNYYPSKLIRSVMRTVVESAEKGYKTASNAMLSVARYLRDLHKTQELINDELSDPIASMKFQTYFLSPLISGIVVTLTVVMLRILEQLAETIAELPFGFPLALTEVNITTFQFVGIVCVYLLETIFILSFFTNGIQYGDDKIGRQKTTGTGLMVGFLIFIVIVFITISMFGPLADALA